MIRPGPQDNYVSISKKPKHVSPQKNSLTTKAKMLCMEIKVLYKQRILSSSSFIKDLFVFIFLLLEQSFFSLISCKSRGVVYCNDESAITQSQTPKEIILVQFSLQYQQSALMKYLIFPRITHCLQSAFTQTITFTHSFLSGIPICYINQSTSLRSINYIPLRSVPLANNDIYCKEKQGKTTFLGGKGQTMLTG